MAPTETPAETRIDFDPQVGDRVHVCYYSDIKAATVIKRTAKFCVVRFDKATLDPSWKPEIIPGGFAGHCANQRDQKWIIEEDPNGKTMKFSDRGFRHSYWNTLTGHTFVRVWRESGQEGSCQLRPGWRHFHDYNF